LIFIDYLELMDLIDAEMTRLIEHKRLTTEDSEFKEVIAFRERLK
jgi:hypothetical protein